MSALRKPVGVALSGEQLLGLLDDRGLSERLDRSGLVFAIGGIDRIDGSPADGVTVDATIAVTVLTARSRRVGWLAAAAAHRDHPYNLARRIASIDHLSNGRAGVLVGPRDGFAPPGPDGREAWGGAGLGPGAPIGLETTADAADALQDLWQSWPADAIAADPQTGIFARSDQILEIGHRGAFEIAGPLTVPTTPQGSPVLAWRASTLAEAAMARQVADLLLWPIGGGGGATLDAVASLTGRAAVFVELPVSAAEPGAALRAALADERVAGVALRAGHSSATLDELLAIGLPDSWATTGAIAAQRPADLRTALGLDPAPPRLAGASAAFAAPQPRP